MNKNIDILERLISLLIERKNYDEDNSYTNQLYNAGNVKILEKIKEEASELIEAGSIEKVIKKEIVHEAADLWFHTMVLLVFNEINPLEILNELERREGVSGIEEKSRRS